MVDDVAHRPEDRTTDEQMARVLPLRRGIAIVIVLATVVLTVSGAALLFVGPRPLLTPNWYALPTLSPPVTKLLPGVGIALVYALGAYVLRNSSRIRVLLWALWGGIALPVAFLIVLGNPFEVLLMRTISSQATGGFSKGVELTAATLRDWPAYMAGWRESFPHVAISLPGWPAVYAGLVQLFGRFPGISHGLAGPLRLLQCHQWGFNNLTDAQVASAWLGVLSPVWSALTVLPLFGLARRVGGQRVASRAVLVWPSVPAATLFMGTLNTPYPLLATLVVLSLWAGITDSRRGPRVALVVSTGALSAAVIILSLALAPLLLLCGLLAVTLPWIGPVSSWRANIAASLAAGLQFATAFALVFVLYAFLAGHSPLRVIVIAMNLHFGMARAYLSSLGLHLWDFVLFAGSPLCVLATLAVARRRQKASLEPPVVLAASFGLTLLILLLSGTARGEVGRVWLFFTPFLAVLAGVGLTRLDRMVGTIMLITQVVWLVALVATTAPVDTWLGPRPAYAEVAAAPGDGPYTPSDARFGDVLHLTGFRAEHVVGAATLAVTLQWEALRQMSAPFYFSAALVGPDGRVLPGVDWQPFNKRFPTTCWTPQLGPIADRIELPLGAEPPEGDWWLSLTVFSLDQDGQPTPLRVAMPDGTKDQQVGVGPLRVDRP